MKASTLRRRAFVKTMVWAGAAASLPAFGLTPSPTAAWARHSVRPETRKKEVLLNKLTLEDFSPHLGTRFLLRTESGQTVEVELIEAAALASSGPRPASLSSRMPFSLVFLAPKQSGLCQQIYRIEHEEMGEFDIFLVPIGMTDKGLQCEAIFN